MTYEECFKKHRCAKNPFIFPTLEPSTSTNRTVESNGRTGSLKPGRLSLKPGLYASLRTNGWLRPAELKPWNGLGMLKLLLEPLPLPPPASLRVGLKRAQSPAGARSSHAKQLT